jgi:drug/metabolite transporter (DMT)-like permease
MSLLLGLFVAASFGSGDFLGGLASRQAPTRVIVAIAQVCAAIGAVAVLLVAGGTGDPRDLALGVAAGFLNVMALSCLYQGLAIGQIGVVAPLTAMVAAIIPVAWGLARGERPSPVALVGVVLAIVAGALISRERDQGAPHEVRRPLLLAAGAGTGFGLTFICYAITDDSSGFWPVLTARTTAAVAVCLFVAVTRTPIRSIGRTPATQAVAAGVLDVMAASALLLVARSGQAATVAPVAALAPGFTVFHARWYLHERFSRTQLLGLLAALVGLALIAKG